MELRSAVRAIDLLMRTQPAVTVHLNREGEAYTGQPAGIWPRKSVAVSGGGTEPVANPVMALSWDARDFVLGLTLSEFDAVRGVGGKDCTIYLDVADIVAVTGPPSDGA